jgi:hypothetical protein
METIYPYQMKGGVEYYIEHKKALRFIGEVGNMKQIGVFDKLVFGNVASFSHIFYTSSRPGLPNVEGGNRNSYHFDFYQRKIPQIMDAAELRVRNRLVLDTIEEKTNTDIGKYIGTEWFAVYINYRI